MQCKQCFINGIQRDGGSIGICVQHKKVRCHTCGNPSGGRQQCAVCAHKEDIARWKNESSPLVFDPDQKYIELELRKERLYEAKFLRHRAVEVEFQSYARAMEAMWAEPEKLQKMEPKQEPKIEVL